MEQALKKENGVFLKKNTGWRPSPPQILVLGFAGLILIGTILLTMPFAMKPGVEPDLLTALFTATSAVCVTGLVVVDTATHWSTAGHVIILVMIQIGGLGFMTMATLFFIILGRKINLKERLLLQESLNQVSIEGVVRLVKYILIFALCMELLFAIILGIRWSADLGWVQGMWYGFFIPFPLSITPVSTCLENFAALPVIPRTFR